MSVLLAAATAAVLAVTARTDTTFAVSAGSRLELENFGGTIAVTGWNRNAIRIQADHGRRTEIVVTREANAIEVDARHQRDVPVAVDYQITVPSWMPLNLSGTYTDIAVEGTRSKIEASTVKGDVTVKGGAEFVALESVEGMVAVSGASGRVEISSVNDDVRVDGVEGELVIEGVNGSVWLYGVKSGMVEATTVNGDIVYDGELREGGRYEFATHNGDIALAVPENGDVTVAVATFSGNFESSFPIQLNETRRGKRFKFTLGSGGAAADLESFQGTIYVVRPGARILQQRTREHAAESEEELEEKLEKKLEKGERK